jgi:transposase
LRAGELTEIYIPEPTDEAIRDLCRARSDAVDDRRRSRHRLKAFLLRHGYRYQGKSAWSAAHERYLRELVLPHPAMKVILEEYLISVQLASERIARCEAAMSDLLGKWRLEPAVRALMAMKGFQTVAAMIVVSELGALDRFTHPRQVMAYLGLVPSEKSSSDRRRQGAITKCGNAHARWLLVECAQHYAAPPKVSKELSRHQQNGAPAAAQQSDGSSGARAVRFYLRITPHSSVLSRALPIRNQVVVRGEQLQRERRCHSTREEQHLHHQAMDLRRQGHGSQSTMSRCVRSELTFRLSTRHLDCRKRAAVNKKNAGKVPLM